MIYFNWPLLDDNSGYGEPYLNHLPIANKTEDCKTFLKTIRQDNDSMSIIAHLNINLLRHLNINLLRPPTFCDQTKGNIDILMISETKIDDSFPTESFLIDGFSTSFLSHCGANGGGIMLYVREEIPVNNLAMENVPLEGPYIEVNLRNTKWKLNCSYSQNKSISLI